MSGRAIKGGGRVKEDMKDRRKQMKTGKTTVILEVIFVGLVKVLM